MLKVAIAVILILIFPGTVYCRINRDNGDGGTGAIQKLCFLNQKVFAFTVPDEWEPSDPQHHYWHIYDFGSSVPANTIVALCLCKLTLSNGYGGSDIAFATYDPKTFSVTDGWASGTETAVGGVVYSVGASNARFSGSWFVYVPVVDRKVWCLNAGYVSPVEVYVVGYVTQENSSCGFIMEFMQQDVSVASDSALPFWTDVDLTGILPHHDGFNLTGVYIALDNPLGTQLDVCFRRKGDLGNGIAWTTCPSDPGTHLTGWIPIGNDGFQYKTSGDSPVNIWIEGYAFDCPASVGDAFSFHVPTQTVPITDSWTISLSYAYKAVTVEQNQSPGSMGEFCSKPDGGTNTEIWYKKNSCGSYTVLAGLGDNKAFQYFWQPGGASEGRQLFVGSIALQAHYSALSSVGDINVDGRVDMKDVSYVARRFMCASCDPLWDPVADVNSDGKIDMKDINTVARHFGEHNP